MARFLHRLRLALAMDNGFYDEVIADPKTQGQSLWVVALYAMAASFGSFGRGGGTAVNVALVVTLATWYLWAFTTYYVGTHFLGEANTPKDRKTVMRIIGFASAPGILRVFGLVPHIGGFLWLGTSIWMLYGASKGLKRALGFSSMQRAVGVTVACYVLSLLVQAMMMVMLLQLFAVYANR